MPWIIGIDEAGYGSNLGPFVMTAAACQVPDELTEANLWQVLREAVRRHKEPNDGRLLIEDSKLVYSSTRGLGDLESGVLAVLSPWQCGDSPCLAKCLDWLCPAAQADLTSEVWYTGTTTLPVTALSVDHAPRAGRFHQTCETRQIVWKHLRSVIVCPTRFNQLLDRWGTKGAVLGQGLAELVQSCRRLDDATEPLFFYVDKHGGRNTYAALLQNAFPEGFVVAQEEGRERSVYRVQGLERPVRLTFQPRAEAEHFCVALASMVSKYLREVLMLEFNRFWQSQVPGLKPTAGYPGDAARFLRDIQPAVQRLGIPLTALWRRK